MSIFMNFTGGVCCKLLTSCFWPNKCRSSSFYRLRSIHQNPPTNFDRSTFGSMVDEWAKSISVILRSFHFISESRNIEFVMIYLWHWSCQLNFIITEYGKLFQLFYYWVTSLLLSFAFYPVMIEKLSWLF